MPDLAREGREQAPHGRRGPKQGRVGLVGLECLDGVFERQGAAEDVADRDERVGGVAEDRGHELGDVGAHDVGPPDGPRVACLGAIPVPDARWKDHRRPLVDANGGVAEIDDTGATDAEGDDGLGGALGSAAAVRARPGLTADDALRVAHWLLDAGAPMDVDTLLEAGRTANLAGDPDLGARFAALAIEAGAGAEAVLLLARAHTVRKRFAEAEATLAPITLT